jgi:CRISPR-associated protein Csm5
MISTPENALSKPEVYETKRIQLTSPILHIGSEASKLSPFEYVQTSDRVYLPDREALAKALNQRGKLQEYIRRIEDREEITSLLKDAFGDDWQTEEFDGEPIFPKTGISRKWTDETITDFRPMIRNGFGQLYIPGSSIKGAIRTAIAYHLLKHSNKYQVPQRYRVSEIESRLRETMGELKRNAKFADDRLFMDNLFTEFDLYYQDEIVNSRNGPNTDFMRAIKVTDSQSLLEKVAQTKKGDRIVFNLPIATEVIVSSKFNDNKAKLKSPIYAELVHNIRTDFTISLDTEMLSWFRHKQDMKIPFENLDELFRICQEFAQEQWNAEYDYWQNIKDNQHQRKNLYFDHIRQIYEPEQCPYSLRIGWATGMLGTTINLCLDEGIVEQVRDTCGIAAPGYEAPKSRRTVVNPKGEIKYVPGWVKFKVL